MGTQPEVIRAIMLENSPQQYEVIRAAVLDDSPRCAGMEQHVSALTSLDSLVESDRSRCSWARASSSNAGPCALP